MSKKIGIRVPAGTAKNVFVRLTEDLLRQFGVRSRANEKHGTKLAEGGCRRKKYSDNLGAFRGSKITIWNRKKTI